MTTQSTDPIAERHRFLVGFDISLRPEWAESDKGPKLIWEVQLMVDPGNDFSWLRIGLATNRRDAIQEAVVWCEASARKLKEAR